MQQPFSVQFYDGVRKGLASYLQKPALRPAWLMHLSLGLLMLVPPGLCLNTPDNPSLPLSAAVDWRR